MSPRTALVIGFSAVAGIAALFFWLRRRGNFAVPALEKAETHSQAEAGNGVLDLHLPSSEVPQRVEDGQNDSDAIQNSAVVPGVPTATALDEAGAIAPDNPVEIDESVETPVLSAPPVAMTVESPASADLPLAAMRDIVLRAPGDTALRLTAAASDETATANDLQSCAPEASSAQAAEPVVEPTPKHSQRPLDDRELQPGQKVHRPSELPIAELSSSADETREPTLESAMAPVEFDSRQNPAATGHNNELDAIDVGEPQSTLAPVRPQPAVFRDRRGSRRAPRSSSRPRRRAIGAGVAAAELLIRLSLHPIQRTAKLFLVLMRPDGLPESITLTTADGPVVHAYDDARYDDADLPEGMDLLGGELRIRSVEGFHWLRSARRVQIFSTTPNDADHISVSAARIGAEHIVLCRGADVDEVRRIAQLAGSRPLVSHDSWPGVPKGCAILSEYNPVRAVPDVDVSLRPLDPGESIAIELTGGLAIRSKVFVEGHAPLITIEGLPEASSVCIGEHTAQRLPDGAWIAPGWDAPGHHVVDVVPGPSLSYEIVRDPDCDEGWTAQNNAHPAALAGAAPWERVEICGARVAGPSATTVIASDTQPILIALDADGTAVPFCRRPDVPASVCLFPGRPSFLLSASGPRRSQGRVISLGETSSASHGRPPQSRFWTDIVRGASSRRLPLIDADDAALEVWRRAVARARRLARAR